MRGADPGVLPAQALRGADGMGGAPLAPTLLALLPSLLRLQVLALAHDALLR